MTNIGPNLIHAMDLAQLELMGVTTNELDESSIPDKCPSCSSSGFAPSINPGQCEFCDGTFGGHPPEPEKDKARMAATMYGSELYPYQKELLTRLMSMDYSSLEEHIMHNYCRDDVMNTMVLDSIPRPFHQMYGGTITGRFPNVMIIDECSTISPWLRDWDFEPDNRDEKDWKRTMFKQDEKSSTPSAAKRAKLRAKRKKRK